MPDQADHDQADHPAPTRDKRASASLAPLPPVRGAGLAHVVIPGTVAWFAVFVVLLILIPTLHAHQQMVWLWTALAGWLLGFVGLAIYAWQRAAARRGSRGASSMALSEQIGKVTEPRRAADPQR